MIIACVGDTGIDGDDNGLQRCAILTHDCIDMLLSNRNSIRLMCLWTKEM